MPVFAVRHVTTYTYARSVSFREHRFIFRPRDSYDQRLISSDLSVDPHPARLRWQHDVFGNCVAVIDFDTRASKLSFDARITVDHTTVDGMELTMASDALDYPFAYSEDERRDLAATSQRHFVDPEDEIGKWARQFVRAGQGVSTGGLLMTLCYAIKESFRYERRLEHGTQPPLFTLHQRRGTCRDFALFMMEAVRSLGFAARFVTGYIYVPSRDSHTTQCGGSTHAWCQVFLPGAGWVEFDPTNGIVGNRDLIRVAVARDPNQAVPLFGSYDGLNSDALDMSVQVDVTAR
jgi:transglutaminase-like putative cysteine protease